MQTNKSFAFVFVILIAFLASLSSCQPRQRVRSPTEKHYDFKGKVVVVDKTQHLLTIAHEDIKDYMTAMTMLMTLRPPNHPFQGLQQARSRFAGAPTGL